MPTKNKNSSKKKSPKSNSKPVSKKSSTKPTSKSISKKKSPKLNSKPISKKSSTKSTSKSASKKTSKPTSNSLSKNSSSKKLIKKPSQPQVYYFQKNISNRDGIESSKTTEYKDGILSNNGQEIKMNPEEFLEYLHSKQQTVSPNVMNQLFPQENLFLNTYPQKCNCGCNCTNCRNCHLKNNLMKPMGIRFIMRGGKLATIPTDLIPYP